MPILLTALAVGGAVLTGCGGGPTQAGSAVIVGSSSVSLSETQRRVDAVLAQPDIVRAAKQSGADAAALARIVVTGQVEHLLLTEAAGRERIAVDEKRLDAELANSETSERLRGTHLAVDPAWARESLRDEIIAQALTAKYLDRLSVTFDTTVAGSRAEATSKARQLASGPAQAAALLRADSRFAKSAVRLRGASAFESYAFGTPAGRVVAVQESPEEWNVTRVIRRDIDPAPPANPAESVLPALTPEAMYLIGRRLIQPLADEIGVRVNPRYGTWDPILLGVLPPGQEPNLVLPAALS